MLTDVVLDVDVVGATVTTRRILFAAGKVVDFEDEQPAAVETDIVPADELSARKPVFLADRTGVTVSIFCPETTTALTIFRSGAVFILVDIEHDFCCSVVTDGLETGFTTVSTLDFLRTGSATRTDITSRSESEVRRPAARPALSADRDFGIGSDDFLKVLRRCGIEVFTGEGSLGLVTEVYDSPSVLEPEESTPNNSSFEVPATFPTGVSVFDVTAGRAEFKNVEFGMLEDFEIFENSV